jgi:hypothetical protein
MLAIAATGQAGLTTKFLNAFFDNKVAPESGATLFFVAGPLSNFHQDAMLSNNSKRVT